MYIYILNYQSKIFFVKAFYFLIFYIRHKYVIEISYNLFFFIYIHAIILLKTFPRYLLTNYFIIDKEHVTNNLQ